MKPRFVAIVGGSGSGKTWLADRLATALGDHASRLSLDDFYADRSHLTLSQRKRINFDHPRSIDWKLFNRATLALRRGRPVKVPHYDFTQSTRAGSLRTCEPRPLILVDGLWLLRRREVRGLFDRSYFVECPAALRLKRRLERDRRERARSEESVRRQFETHTEPMHARFVEPQSRLASEVLPSPVRMATVRRLHRDLLQLLELN